MAFLSLGKKDDGGTPHVKVPERYQPTPDKGLLITEGSYDFLEGGFARAERYRQSMIVVIMVTATVLVGLVLSGMYFRTVASNAEAGKLNDEQQTAQIRAELAVLDAAGGFTAEELRAQAAVRAPILGEAVSGEVDMVALVSTVNTALPGSMTLNSISTQTAAPPAPAPTGQATPTPAPTPSASATPVDTTPVTTVTIVSTAPTLEAANQFRDNLARSPGFASIEDPTWTGTQGAWTVTVMAEVGPELFTARAQRAANADSFGLPKPTPTPAPTPTAVP